MVLMFFSMDPLVIKNQILSTKCQPSFFLFQGGEDSHASSLFSNWNDNRKFWLKFVVSIWFLVTGQSNEKNIRNNFSNRDFKCMQFVSLLKMKEIFLALRISQKKNFLYIAVQFGVVSLGCIKVINVMVICISRNTWLELNGEYL